MSRPERGNARPSSANRATSCRYGDLPARGRSFEGFEVVIEFADLMGEQSQSGSEADPQAWSQSNVCSGTRASSGSVSRHTAGRAYVRGRNVVRPSVGERRTPRCNPTATGSFTSKRISTHHDVIGGLGTPDPCRENGSSATRQSAKSQAASQALYELSYAPVRVGLY